ncbi:MAG: YARHG domain-containing protein [Roseitalea sp.]|nr:YARHG domain-containing protein [Roseitalea sp.]MBO6722465.1 YARHG domain-containing protein [Roseitalea sp.]MBO6742991.1 YARHG domain-containing protein [Roseitalea sp.]
MITRFLVAAAVVGAMAAPAAAQASCFDLWYERNLIYAENGYCFRTDLARRTFAGYECWTRNPSLSGYEQGRVDAIRAEERRRGCNVN